MWTAIKYVSSGITLIAFICALAAWLYKSYLRRRERLINSVPENQRAGLVERTFLLFKVDTAKLTREHQYNLALEQIHEQTKKFMVTAGVIVIIAGLITIVSFVAIPKIGPPPTPSPTPMATAESLSGEIERVEVITNPGGGVQVFMYLSIKNTGTQPTGVKQYAIRIDHVSSKSINYGGPIEEMEGRYKLPQAGGGQATTVQPQDSIMGKTRQAIPIDQRVSGWLRIALPNPFLKPDDMRQAGIRYDVSFADWAGKTYHVVYQVR